MARQLKVARRGADMPVPEQPLNRVEVDTRFEQVPGKGMPQRILTLLMNRPLPSFTTDTIRSTAST